MQGKGKKGSRRKKVGRPVPAFRFSPPPIATFFSQLFKCQKNYENFKDLKKRQNFARKRKKGVKEEKVGRASASLPLFSSATFPAACPLQLFSNVKIIMKTSEISKRRPNFARKIKKLFCKEKEKRDRGGKKWDSQPQPSAFLLRHLPCGLPCNFSQMSKLL